MAAAASEPGPPDDEPAEREPEPEPPDEEPAEPEPAPPDEEPAEPGPAPVAQAEPPSAEPEPVLPPLSLRSTSMLPPRGARGGRSRGGAPAACFRGRSLAARAGRRRPVVSCAPWARSRSSSRAGLAEGRNGRGAAGLPAGLYEPLLELAEAASGLPIRQHGLEGPQETLTRTDVAQPALFALARGERRRSRGRPAARLRGRPQPRRVHRGGGCRRDVEEEGMSVVSLRGRRDGRGPGRQAGRDGGGDRPGAQRVARQGLRARPRVAREHQLANADRVLGRGGAVDRLVELAGRPARKGRFGCRSGRPFTAS